MSEASMATLEKFDLNIRAARDAFIKLDHACLSLSRQLMEAKDENAKLRELVNSYADLFEKEAATNNGYGPYYSGEDWLALANDMRIELAKCCGELGIEVE